VRIYPKNDRDAFTLQEVEQLSDRFAKKALAKVSVYFNRILAGVHAQV
jgi:hypothetical protein